MDHGDNLCVFCGVVLAKNPNATFNHQLNWQTEVRALISKSGRGNPILTGVGFFFGNVLWVPPNPYTCYTNPESLASFSPWFGSGTYWAFPFHNECWGILVAKLAASDYAGVLEPHDQLEWNPPATLVKHLFDLLYCLPWERRIGSPFNHNFGGATKFRTRDFFEAPSNFPMDWDFLLSRPDLTLVRLLRAPPAIRHRFGLQPTMRINPTDCFSNFPKEIRDLILGHLEIEDVCTARLASRAIAYNHHPAHLPRSYWAQRFWPNNEMGFFGVRPDLHDLPPLYFDLRRALKDITIAGNLRNRHRVWLVLDDLFKTLLPLLYHPVDLSGPSTQKIELFGEQYIAGDRAQALIRKDESENLIHEGGCVFACETLIFSLNDSQVAKSRVSVSFITYNCIRYICGMKVTTDTGTSEISRAGINFSSTEEIIYTGSFENLVGVRAVFSPYGLIGLQFLTYGPNGNISVGVGFNNDLPQGVGLVTLTPKDEFQISGLRFWLDACKVVSIQLLESLMTDAEPNTTQEDEMALTRSLWYPVEPSPHDYICYLQSTSTMPQGFGFRSAYLLNMHFGRQDGSYLGLLTRIVARYGGHCQSLRGFTFFYANGTETCYGESHAAYGSTSLRCVERSYAMDGVNGERIIHASVDSKQIHRSDDAAPGEDPGSRRVLKLITNFGRLLEFEDYVDHVVVPPGYTALVHYGFPLQASFFFSPTLPKNYRLASQWLYHWVGGQSTASDRVSSRSRYMSIYCDSTPIGANPRYSQAPYYAASKPTTLPSVLRPHPPLAKGVRDHTRQEVYISGICFEFWDTHIPVYVGQWLDEAAVFEIPKDSRITHLDIWQHIITVGNESAKGIRYIAGISLQATKIPGRYNFCLMDKSTLSACMYSENEYEQLSELAWIFGQKYDYVHVLSEPAQFTKPLIFSNPEPKTRESQIISHAAFKLLCTKKDDHGNIHPIKRIDVFFDRQNSGLPTGIGFFYGRRRNNYALAGYKSRVKVPINLSGDERLSHVQFVPIANIWNPIVLYFWTQDGGAYLVPRYGEAIRFLDPPGPPEEYTQTVRFNENYIEEHGISHEAPCVGLWVYVDTLPAMRNTIAIIGSVHVREGLAGPLVLNPGTGNKPNDSSDECLRDGCIVEGSGGPASREPKANEPENPNSCQD
ncbi:hypothetical protein BGZ63DRAFT_419335 [Mariannaea sp. PMI_226]|nr:hypothetical protein BGZ63DRAFT_419335 [Mariannaea sp. PMI_226]